MDMSSAEAICLAGRPSAMSFSTSSWRPVRPRFARPVGFSGGLLQRLCGNVYPLLLLYDAVLPTLVQTFVGRRRAAKPVRDTDNGVAILESKPARPGQRKRRGRPDRLTRGTSYRCRRPPILGRIHVWRPGTVPKRLLLLPGHVENTGASHSSA